MMRKYWQPVVWVGFVALGTFRFRDAIPFWLVGISMSLMLMLMDRMLYVWWLKPYEQLSIQIQYWFQKRDYLAALKLMKSRGEEQTKLALRSAGFAFLWPLLALFVSTSTGSVVALGMVMGLGFGLALELVLSWSKPAELSTWFFWQIKRVISVRETRAVVAMYVMAFVLIMTMILLQ